MPNFSQRIKGLRNERHLKQRELADVFSVKLRTYQGYEYGESYPEVAKLIAIADFFDVSLDYLIGNSENTGERSVPQFVIDMFCRATPDKREKLVELMKVVEQMN